MAKLVSRLRIIADATRREVGEAVQVMAEKIRDDAKTLAPFRTGKLRRGIRKRKTGDSSAVVGVFADEVPYAVFVHFGTSKMAGNPFLLAAFWQNAQLFRQKLLEAAKRAAK